MSTRRQVLQAIGTAVGAASAHHLASGTGLIPTPEVFAAVGEEYNGLLLLPEGANIPSNVRFPAQGLTPTTEAYGTTKRVVPAVERQFASASELQRLLPFQMLTLGQLPSGLQNAGAYLLTSENGPIAVASVGFRSLVRRSNRIETSVVVRAQQIFPSPFPIWALTKWDAIPSIPEKTDLLPKPGVILRVRFGYFFYWIQNDVLFTLQAENEPSRLEAERLARSLVPVAK